MLSSILKKVRQQLVLMPAVALLLVATYVGAGHLFMPAVSGYVSFFEEQFFERSGIPISVESLVGDFDGFNPILHVIICRFCYRGSPCPTSHSKVSSVLFLAN